MQILRVPLFCSHGAFHGALVAERSQALADIKLTGEALKKKLVEELDRRSSPLCACIPHCSSADACALFSGRITREEADTLVRLAAEQAAKRAEQEFIEQEMQKVVVKSLDDGGSIKALELTASPVIGSTELMKKQASQMQVRAALPRTRPRVNAGRCRPPYARRTAWGSKRRLPPLSTTLAACSSSVWTTVRCAK